MARGKPFPQLDALVKDLKNTVFLKGVDRAQKQALRDWQKSTRGVGLAARFERQGGDDYDIPGLWKSKNGKQPLVETGAFRSRVLNPSSRHRPAGSGIKKGPNPGRRLPFGGGPMNFLKDKRGTERVVVVTGKESRVWRPHNVRAHQRKGASVRAHDRSGYVRVTDITESRVQKSNKTWRQAYGMQQRDQAYLDRRVRVYFRKYLRTLKFTKTGRRRAGFESKYLQGAR